jgi:hypothetical protein
MASRLRRLTYRLFKLRKYEDHPARKLYLIYSITLGLCAVAVMLLGQMIDSPQLIVASKLTLLLLLSYGLLIIVTFDNYIFLLHVEGVIKALLCWIILLALRRYWLSFYGPLNAYEICLAALLSIFGRSAFFSRINTWKHPLKALAAQAVTKSAGRAEARAGQKSG